MRALLSILAAAVLLLPLAANATIINIPEDYPTIQEGIDHSSDGDTVLVQPDTYYENLDFHGHNVVLASLFLMTGDTAYISSTIIDGSQSGSVIIFESSEDSTAQVVAFTIQNGQADYAGGGIYCQLSSPAISNNTVSGNWARNGGGIYCYRSTPTISNNTISGNTVEWSGGGICSDFQSTPTISKNIINGNSAGYDGGGICCEYSNPAVNGNTISRNCARAGGGIYCGNSNPAITNTILWADRAPNGPEIRALGGNPTVTYCDVQGGWPGTGNIDADPVFVGPYNEDFHLRWRSPCIDAGDPASPLDPDGTRKDMGAFYFNQDVDGIVELYPHDTPILIPPEGGDIVYDGWVFNFSNNPLTIDIRSYLYLDGVGRYHRVHKHKNVSIAVGDSIGDNSIIRPVPGFSPAGDYTLVAYIGDFPTREIIDSCYFYFTKTGSIGGGIADWLEGDEWLKESHLAGSNLPNAYALSQNYPNPFNATTIIHYQLPVDGYVKLEVYNTLGRKVATLVDSKQQTGCRSAAWDASEVSSGLYFYKLSAGDYTQTKRMMLVK